MRIAVGGFHIESSAFTPYRSGSADFHVLEGKELLHSYPFIAGDESSGETRREQERGAIVEPIPGVEWIPLVHMRALPGGPIAADFYQDFFHKFTSKLSEAAQEGLDGVLLDIHGAALVEGLDDAEGSLATTVREIVGQKALISATMDLHGNISDALFESCDLLTCYRTAPHIDTLETRYRAARILTDSLKTKRPIYTAKISVPILLPGEKTSTVVEPGKSLYLEIDRSEAHASVLDAAIWMGFPWGDEDRCRGTVVVSADSHEVAQSEAIRLANAFWDRKDAFEFVGPAVDCETAVSTALQAAEKPFFISDTGDNTGAGGIGDLVVVLNELFKQHQNKGSGKRILVAAIYDPEVAQSAFCQEGETISFSLGGKLAPQYGSPFAGTARVRKVFHCPQGKRSALLDVDVQTGGVSIIVTEGRTQYGRLEMFNNAGIRTFNEYDVIVVKMGYLEPDLAEAAGSWAMAITPGAVDQDLSRLRYTSSKCQEVYPLAQSTINFEASNELKIHSRNS
ncbi:M81 family metallopeptidase [Trueperella sp. LYQ141]|uniref:M81 family metallopeptidase n=1 Tax=Trueperella sp. LYQ141 TaxID=3391058 RepID=UPI00398328D2